MTCHTTAPHPAAPWRGTTASGTTHTTTDVANAAECARCHLNNLRLITPQTVPSGTTPGCFNNTMCHGAASGHPAGWAVSGHQTAAKAAASSASGLDYCSSCHGTDFRGGTSGVSCLQCHTTSPHAKPWLASSGATTYIHTSTDPSNALACSRCHTGGAKLSTPTSPAANPDCFNNTLCHGSITSHAFPNPGSLHKSSTTGCSSCHAIGSSSSPYPAATAGVPPDCKSCHKQSTATTMDQMSGCSDCHGDALTGRPNGATGTAFPNLRKRHSSPGEHAVDCSTCHAGGGTGTATHGNSNNIVKSRADVILNGTASGMAITRNSGTGAVTCNGTCHGKNHPGYSW